MDKELRLKKGFSLVEIAVILMVIGVLFIAAFSIIQGRSSSIERTRTENRIQQIRDILLGSVKYTGFLPAYDGAPLWENGTDSRKFEKLVVFPDGYGNKFNYLLGEGHNLFYLRMGSVPGSFASSPLCEETISNITLHFNSPDVPDVGNVAFFVHTYGKNLDNQTTITPRSSGPFGIAYDVNIPITDKNFDDQYLYMTIDEIKSELQCAPPAISQPLKILTKSLATKPMSASRVDTRPADPSAPEITRNIIYLQDHAIYARWCVEVAEPGVDQEVAKKQIEVFRLNSRNEFLDRNERIPIKANGNCQSDADYTDRDHYDLASLQVVLHRDSLALTPGVYYYYVNVRDTDPVTLTNRSDRLLIQIVVPNGP